MRPQDIWKLPPVSHRTSALWGRCPKRMGERKERKDERKGKFKKRLWKRERKMRTNGKEIFGLKIRYEIRGRLEA